MRDQGALHRNSLASVRGVRGAVRAPVRAQTRAVIGLCGVCGIALTRAGGRVHAHASGAAFIQKSELPVHVVLTPHTPHTSAFMRVSPRTGARTAPRTPRTATFRARDSFITRHPKGMEVEVAEKESSPAMPAITCGPENVGHFNARLRAELPGFHAFAKALHERGMIDGLRGAKIGPVGALARGVQPTPSPAEEKRLADRAWANGQGVRK